MIIHRFELIKIYTLLYDVQRRVTTFFISAVLCFMHKGFNDLSSLRFCPRACTWHLFFDLSLFSSLLFTGVARDSDGTTMMSTGHDILHISSQSKRDTGLRVV